MNDRITAMQRSARRLTNLVQQPKAGWYRVVRNDAGPTRVDIYDQIGGGGWFDSGVTAVDFVNELAQINGDIEVHINSPGGDVFDGLAIYNSLAQRPGKVTTIVDGLAASAASFIAMAGTQRLISPGAMMMIHEASGVCLGNADDMRETADLLDKVSANIASIYAAHSGRADGWRSAMQAETWYTADEAVAAGLAHRIAERPAEGALAAAAGWDLTAYARVPERLRNAARPAAADGGSTPFEPAPYRQGNDENVQCPTCDKYNAPDARFCDQCGAKLVGRDDVSEAANHGGPVLGVESMPVTNRAMPVHHTATVDEPWDGPAAVAAMPNDDQVLEYCHAWQSAEAAAAPHKSSDDDADDQKANYKFPHHKTKGGPANLAACRNGLARLSNADIPDLDRDGVRAHLQAHLDDAKSDDDSTNNHAGMPGWLHNTTAPRPAWLNSAKEATQ
ncbi:ATP-dependent Clp endopeptidase proteolytic subunit ClpP [Kitasatospora sp. GAS204A]|uniref:head maturation protease, ClpP-related n=1 Tax=unclassified Kitasatospora TaxID=2633591 RepID=UPI0024738929|nr:head maturation protease, ClpP-related [Kitasatospora sp. GAS204B]MDH6116901.1 ATP-dependent Clp endopeptidase proteolytic subunit ClpP [Kitasatospora sp. GAS204B]